MDRHLTVQRWERTRTFRVAVDPETLQQRLHLLQLPRFRPNLQVSGINPTPPDVRVFIESSSTTTLCFQVELRHGSQCTTMRGRAHALDRGSELIVRVQGPGWWNGVRRYWREFMVANVIGYVVTQCIAALTSGSQFEFAISYFFGFYFAWVSIMALPERPISRLDAAVTLWTALQGVVTPDTPALGASSPFRREHGKQPSQEHPHSFPTSIIAQSDVCD